MCEQPPYSILVRGIERAVLPTCERYGMAVIPWSPLAGGWLTGKYRKGDEVPADSRLGRRFGNQFNDPRQVEIHERRLDAVEELLKVAGDAGVSLTHIAMAFVLEHPAVTSAIIGPRTMEQLEDAARGGRRRASTPTCSTASTRSCRPAPTSPAATRGSPSGCRSATAAAER